MVKVGNATMSSDGFYDRFFDLVKRYLVLSEAPGLTTDLKRFRPLSRWERLGASGSRAGNRAAVCKRR